MRAALLALAACLTCAGAGLQARIDAAINASPEARQAFWGIRVTDARTGAVLFTRNADKFFVPASNTKLFTTALALARLGPDFRFATRVEANALPDVSGRVKELRLIGGGDPNLSARIIPYVREGRGDNPLAVIHALADAVVAKGVRTVEGDIIGDDTAFLHEPFPDGWGLDDPVWEYGAPVSALTLNDNAFEVQIQAGAEAGAPAVLHFWPPIEYFVVHNRTRTVESGRSKIDFERLPGSRELMVTGVISRSDPRDPQLLAVDDPALFAAIAFRDALLERGVRVGGSARAVHRESLESPVDSSGIELARHTSAPLGESLKIINKVSQNLHAELILRTVARVKNGIGTQEAGLEEMEAFLKEIGVKERQFHFEDGSGLSRLSLVTPSTVSRLLLFMYGSRHRDLWLDTLPVGGGDGTLEKRFPRNPAGTRIRAKTGSLSHVSSLSGYALGPRGRTLAFSIMVNNYNAPARPIRTVIDRIALALLK